MAGPQHHPDRPGPHRRSRPLSASDRPVVAGGAGPVRRSVLIVEDNPLMAELLAEQVSEVPADVVGVVEDVESALALFEQLEPDVVVTDMTLPGVRNGLDLCREVSGSAAVIVVSAAVDDIVVRDGHECGAIAVLAKSQADTAKFRSLFEDLEA